MVILADRIDTSNNGKILVSASSVDESQPGNSGRSVVVCAKIIENLDVAATGGRGGNGRKGKNGRRGEHGKWNIIPCGEDISDPEIPSTAEEGIDGKDGRPGENGEQGASGGSGGSVLVIYHERASDDIDIVVDTNGGIGGRGGAGGKGGPGGRSGGVKCNNGRELFSGQPGSFGSDGERGSPGFSGTDGPALITARDEEIEFWNSARKYSGDWPQYRMAVGEYYYRQSTINSFQLAYDDFAAVVAIDPGHTLASHYLMQMRNNHIFLGLPRYHDIIPDFDRYEQIVVQHRDFVFHISATVDRVFLANIEMNFLIRNMEREASNADQTLHNMLEQERTWAELDKEEIERQISNLDAEIRKKEGELAARKAELENQSLDFFGIVKTVFSLGSTIIQIVKGGASVVPFVESLITRLYHLTPLKPR